MRNLLFISHRIPYPPDRGEKIRGWNLLRHLSKSYNVHLGFPIDDPADWQHLDTLRPFCADIEAFGIDKRWQKLAALARFRPGRPLMLDYYRHAGLRAWAHRTLAQTPMDIAYIFSTAMAPYVLEAPEMAGSPRLILDMQDIDSEKWTDYAKPAAFPMRLVWAREGRTLLAYERLAAASCERTLLVTRDEVRRLETLAPELRGKLDWLEQGVDVEKFSPDLAFDTPYPDAAPRLVLTGNMDYWPNVDAAIWFAHEVMPLLRTRPDAPEFVVVGANPTLEVMALAALPGVRVTGRVADVRPYLAHAAAAVVPLRIARGIQNKVLEGMAMGRPVIASPQAFEGVRAQAGHDLLVADGASQFAQLVSEILDGGYAGLGAAGRRTMQAGYSWTAVMDKLDHILAPPAA